MIGKIFLKQWEYYIPKTIYENDRFAAIPGLDKNSADEKNNGIVYFPTTFTIRKVTWQIDSEHSGRSYKRHYRTIVDEIRAVWKALPPSKNRRTFRQKRFGYPLL